MGTVDGQAGEHNHLPQAKSVQSCPSVSGSGGAPIVISPRAARSAWSCAAVRWAEFRGQFTQFGISNQRGDR